MINIGFGKLIEILIQFSGEKNNTLAKYLGYDVSYISKWIGGSMLPSQKHISRICDSISSYMIENLKNNTKEEFISYFNLKEDITDDEIKYYLNKKINEEFIFSHENNDKSNGYKSQNNLNSVTNIKPRMRKKLLEEEVMKIMKEEEKVNIILMANTFSLDRELKIKLANVGDSNYIDNLNNENSIKLLVSFDEEIKDIIFDTILFINLIKAYTINNFEIHSCRFTSNTFVVVIEDKMFYNSVYLDNDKCLYTNHSTDKIVVEDAYDTLVEMLETKSINTFLTKDSSQMILDRNYMQYIIGKDLRWVIGDINELFMPSDLFLEIGKKVFGENKEVIEELDKINAILQNATYNSDIQVLMYESGLRKYISTGKLSFFNKQVVLDFDQRQRHIEYMEKMFKEQDNIDIRFINGDLVEAMKNNSNPTLYLSKVNNYLKIQDNDGDSKYLFVKDKRLDNILNDFFKTVWKSEDYKINTNREEIIARISDSLNYARILNDNFRNNH